MEVFRIEPGPEGIAHLVMDDPARRLNVIDEAALDSLEQALASIETDTAIRGVVVRSGKSGSFIAGADVAAIAAITDPEAARTVVRRAHAVFARLAALRVPTVAAIDGVCLGGGTELALACDSRVASEDPRTQIGLPEVMLGILPGFGGTTRLPRLIGLPGALDLLLSGRTLDGRRAERMGLVARATPSAWLLAAAERRVRDLMRLPDGGRRDAYAPRDAAAWFLDRTPFGRALAFQQARASVKARTAGNYPAPLAILRVLEHAVGQPVEHGLALEVDEVAHLATGPVCKNLIRIFLLSERAKKDAVVADASLKPAAVTRLALAGAGVMGGGIAELASRNGIEVRVRDLAPAALTRALLTVRSLIDERGRKKRMRAGERDNQMACVLPTLDLSGVARADFAMEAVVEDLDVKRRVFAELEVRMRPDAVLATNTSSLSVDALAAGLQHPQRFCGFHFFNPVHRMPLVEVVRGAATSDATLVTAVGLARRLGKTPVVVSDAPGFVVNRILMPYLREALHLLEEGYPLADIDASMTRFGMPMGPFAVVDEVGLDVADKVAKVLAKAFPDTMSEAPALGRLVAAGRLGKKSGLGFYRHRGRTRTADPAVATLLGFQRVRRAPSLEALAERMVLAMINEAARCLGEGVVSDAGMLDVAMIFGTGFPPHRGGVLRHADALGLARVESRLLALRAEKGERFAPAPLLSRMVAMAGTFTEPAPAR
jgi:3-hydroxyacyl-CoA dehydrogenase / enoyl-CoA hydratase / 3-hydroxybutyryl-CoA epimerase